MAVRGVTVTPARVVPAVRIASANSDEVLTRRVWYVFDARTLRTLPLRLDKKHLKVYFRF